MQHIMQLANNSFTIIIDLVPVSTRRLSNCAVDITSLESDGIVALCIYTCAKKINMYTYQKYTYAANNSIV